MTYDEIVQALRCCSYGCVCEKCPSRQDENCIDHVNVSAAAAIERLVAENAALREKVPQWVSVKDADRRAPAGQRVIATDGVFVGEAYRTSADSWRRYDDYRLWHDAAGRTVTNWMPLPPLPEEDDEWND
jgi:hypothetical protein